MVGFLLQTLHFLQQKEKVLRKLKLSPAYPHVQVAESISLRTRRHFSAIVARALMRGSVSTAYTCQQNQLKS